MKHGMKVRYIGVLTSGLRDKTGVIYDYKYIKIINPEYYKRCIFYSETSIIKGIKTLVLFDDKEVWTHACPFWIVYAENLEIIK